MIVCSYFGHHAPPGDDVGLAFCPRVLLQIYQSLQQALQMIIRSVIKLSECIKAFGEINSKLWRIVVPQRAFIQMELVLVIV